MKSKPYWEMTAEELAEATKQFDAPFVVDKSRPLTPSERKRWRSVKKAMKNDMKRIALVVTM